MTKRAKFIISSLLLSLGFLAVNLLQFENRFFAIALLGALTFVLFWFSLTESIRRDGTLLTLVLPVLYTVGVGLFWFLLPSTIFARFPVLIFYALGLYALALTANIFTVSAIRTIALVRAARGVGFVLTLVTSFFLFDAVLSLRTNLILTSLMILLISFPLFLQGLWVSLLDRVITKKLFYYSAILSTGVVQIAFLLYFWPVSVVIGSLFLTVSIYVLLGLGQAQLEGRLFERTIREYISVGCIVFLAMFLFTRWGG